MTPKTDDEDEWNLSLVKNPDILAGINRDGLMKVGFAAETHDLLANAQGKLERKNLAMIIANDAVATLGSADSTATILTRGGSAPEQLESMSKTELASVVLARIECLLEGSISG